MDHDQLEALLYLMRGYAPETYKPENMRYAKVVLRQNFDSIKRALGQEAHLAGMAQVALEEGCLEVASQLWTKMVYVIGDAVVQMKKIRFS